MAAMSDYYPDGNEYRNHQLSRIADAVEELVRSVQTVIETTKQTVLNVATVRDVDLS